MAEVWRRHGMRHQLSDGSRASRVASGDTERSYIADALSAAAMAGTSDRIVK